MSPDTDEKHLILEHYVNRNLPYRIFLLTSVEEVDARFFCLFVCMMIWVFGVAASAFWKETLLLLFLNVWALPDSVYLKKSRHFYSLYLDFRMNCSLNAASRCVWSVCCMRWFQNLPAPWPVHSLLWIVFIPKHWRRRRDKQLQNHSSNCQPEPTCLTFRSCGVLKFCQYSHFFTCTHHVYI